MTQKRYYEDAYLTSFSAKILKQEQDPESGKWFVVLDQTAFYPTGGGQPFDTGKLNHQKVINVEEIADAVRHYLNEPLPEGEDTISGTIDWDRRFDHMQQHAGQHILSAACEELFGFETVSFHLGSEELTIDLNTDCITSEQAKAAERLANRIILENRPIKTKWITPEEATDYPLRKKLSVTADIRLVIIPNFDYSGCGGTHPHTTGEVGSIKILNWERQRQKIRVQFVCGNRVLIQLGKKHQILKQLSPLLNAPEQDLESTVLKLLESQKEKDKQLAEAQASLLDYEAKALLHFQTKERINGRKIVTKVLQNRQIQDLQKLARSIVAQSPEAVVILVSENGEKIQIVCARGTAAEGNMKKMIAELLPSINGKGGGNEVFAQGGGNGSISGQQLLEMALDRLS